MRRLLVLAGAVMLAACESTSVPEGVAGRYSLNTVEGERLPVWANATGVQGSGRQLRSATLHLREPDHVELALQARMVDAQGSVTQTLSDTLRGTWNLQGDLLTLNVQGAALYWIEPVATVASNRRIDAVLHWVAPAYTGFAHVPVDAAFTR